MRLQIVAFLLRVSVASSPALAVMAATVTVRADEPCTYDVEIFTAPTCGEPIGIPPTFPAAINAHGDVAGHYWQCAIPSRLEAFVRTADGAFFTIPRPPGVISMEAIDLNDSGQVTGTMELPTVSLAFRWTNGTFETLPQISDCPLTVAVAINADGVVAANRRLAGCNAWLACTWNGTSIVDIPSAHGPSSVATDIDDAGTVVGWMGQQYYVDGRAFILGEGSLNILKPPEGYVATAAYSVVHTANGPLVAGAAFRTNLRGPGFLASVFVWHDGKLELLPDPPGFNRCLPWDIIEGPTVIGICEGVSPLPPALGGRVWSEGEIFDPYARLPDRDFLPAYGLPSFAANGSLATTVATPQLTTVAAIVRSPTGADFNLDCDVDAGDMASLIAAWLRGDSSLDLDGDQSISGADLALLLGSWSG